MQMIRKVAVVTGGASGIGRAICSELVQQNVFVIISDIRINFIIHLFQKLRLVQLQNLRF